MFDSFREKLQTVQGNISASLRGFSGSELNVSLPGKQLHCDKLNISAGTEVLERFQSSWVELHAQTQENAKKAEVVDELIGKLHRRLEVQWRSVNQGSSVLSKLPEVIHEVDALTEKLGVLDELFSSVEKSLIHLENLIETRNLQDRQLDHRFQLALYKEKKLSQLETARVNLAREHAEKVALHEARQQRIQRERQEAFEQQFKQDLSLYKESNNILKVETRGLEGQEVKLEEIELDNDDPAALDEFLHESTPERNPDESEDTPQNDSA